MSAIACIYNINKEPASTEYSNTIMNALQQFPANDIQTWHKNNIFLGCHAQWITPESVGEVLPYYNEERKLAITADAIIDNREDLFNHLQVNPSKQSEMPDSQLILLAYEKWGEDTPKFLVGDFAFIIWDERKQKLFAARDFSGSRTLYFFQDENRLAFCTTMKPLLQLPYVHKNINEYWMAEYLAIAGMIDVVDPSHTVFKGINQLAPSHSITVEENKVHINRYCQLTSGEKLKLKSDEEYVEAFQDVFQKAVNSRLRTHRNIGAQLSGGLDSGSIVSFANKELKKENKDLYTFSYVPAKDFQDFTPKNIVPNERPLIESTVRHVGGIKGHYLDFEGRNSYLEIDDFLDTMEMPYKFFENSYWLTGMYEEANKNDLGILLNGGRGNLSVSWGSALDYYGILLKKLKLIRLYQELNQYSNKVGGARLRRLPTIAKVAFPFINEFFSKKEVYSNPMLINTNLAERTNVFNKLKFYGMDETGWFSSANIYEQRKRHFEDVCHWNASNTLAAKLSLKYSLWKRDPTNDIRVIRFCLTLPEDQYVKNGLDRALIRRATKDYLPDNIRLNQQLRGVQGADWVHRMIPYWNKFIGEVKEMIADNEAVQYLNIPIIKEALKKAENGVTPEYVLDTDSKVLMRSLIVFKFIKKFT
ncbi:asparagine synthase (glutamine-hydrolyzing) [Evansella vedderi]|uniref:asparagine synthase (glutamine-hydrolyzing) n=1 Tax=Evansella vedderi TaxID=38282 RepID=A0ABU0A0S4_9BACI|nr:lasso peptide isopeptide bond-forming cyclase [Evansella vedderi]MDQ0256586.1 asparagine synthase (glutamine-hydrolyzing) [Evansella vedderi]